MKTIEELNLGFSDVQNYSQRGNKQLFSSIFVKNSYLEDLLNNNIYFLIGEKGIGKTAYATYLSNNEYKGKKGILKFISDTVLQKVIQILSIVKPIKNKENAPLAGAFSLLDVYSSS